jgi:MFS family permease
MRDFYILSLSQLISGLGSNITIFAIGLWVYNVKSGSMTDLALIHFVNEIPRLLISPIAGIVTDRVNRKAIMVVCDLIAALMTVFLGY